MNRPALGQQRSRGDQERSDDKIIAKPAQAPRSAGEQERSDDKMTDSGRAAQASAAAQKASSDERSDEKKIGATDTGAAKPASKLPTFATGAPGTPKIAPTPTVDKNVPTGGAPAAGAAALTKQTTNKPATPSAKFQGTIKDFQAQNSGASVGQALNAIQGKTARQGGANDPSVIQGNIDKQQGSNPGAGPKAYNPGTPLAPATPSASRPAAPRPATPSAGSSSPTGSSTMRDAAMSDRGGGGTSSTSQNGGSAMPSGAGGNAALRAAKRDGDGTTSDTFNRFQSNKPGTTSDTFNRLQSNKPGTYTRASQTPSNEVGSPANDTVGTSQNQNRTPASDILARKTKLTSALNTQSNNTSVAESFTDTIMKVLKG